ncbi:MAG: cysteine desulfurase CsdA [Verrucomicrobia bacterium CG_4_10_14_3_um_filter_43_23]
MSANCHQKTPFSVESVRQDFPILSTVVKNKPLVYLDNAATAQKPAYVIDAISHYYQAENSNVHRGVHYLAEKATNAYENARKTIARALNAAQEQEIIFTRQTTEAINLVVQSWGRTNLSEGDEVIITVMEHHANIVPWQILAAEKGFRIRVAPMTDAGELMMDEFEKLFNDRTKFVSVTHASNSLGTINPVRSIIKLAHDRDIPVLLDGAQSIVHFPIDVQELDCDFFAFSGHKLYGPTGIGILYAKRKHLDNMPPYQGGGDMIEKVTFEKTTFRAPPMRFEAGTPNIAGAIGLAKAFEYLAQFDPQELLAHEQKLHDYATEKLKSIDHLRLIGTAKEKVSVVSFVLDNVHPHDIGTFLNEEGIAIRVGHHCNQPLMQRLNLPSTARASFAFYNTIEEVDRLAAAVHKVAQFF